MKPYFFFFFNLFNYNISNLPVSNLIKLILWYPKYKYNKRNLID